MILLNDDCMKVMNGFIKNNIQVDTTLTDIPYDGVNQTSGGLRDLDKGVEDIITFDLDSFLNNLFQITRNSFYIFCGSEQVSQVIKYFKRTVKIPNRQMIILKKNPSPINCTRMPVSGIENLVFAKKPGAPFYSKYQLNYLYTKTVPSKQRICKTEKHVDLLKELIQLSTKPGDTIFDPCMGSGSTGIAALELDRNFIGVELDKSIFEKTTKRLQGYDS